MVRFRRGEVKRGKPFRWIIIYKSKRIDTERISLPPAAVSEVRLFEAKDGNWWYEYPFFVTGFLLQPDESEIRLVLLERKQLSGKKEEELWESLGKIIAQPLSQEEGASLLPATSAMETSSTASSSGSTTVG